MNKPETLHQALRLAERGVPVFPCLSNKAPACPGGFKAATADLGALEKLWLGYPGELVGMPTGTASGIDCLDIDPRHGGDAWLSDHRKLLPLTREHQTRSGGQHLLFRAQPGLRNSASKIAPGVDVRATGGYIVWWPADGFAPPVHEPIAEWPAWLLSLMHSPPAPPPAPEMVRYERPPSEKRLVRLIRSVLLKVMTAPPGKRHAQLRAASYTLGGLLHCTDVDEAEAARELFDAVKRAGGNMVNDRNARATIASGLAKGAASPLSTGGRNA